MCNCCQLEIPVSTQASHIPTLSCQIHHTVNKTQYIILYPKFSCQRHHTAEKIQYEHQCQMDLIMFCYLLKIAIKNHFISKMSIRSGNDTTLLRPIMIMFNVCDAIYCKPVAL